MNTDRKESGRRPDPLGRIVAAGPEERFATGIRYGMEAKPGWFVRVYGKYFERGDSRLIDGESAADAWQSGQGGFRLDWDPAGRDTLTVQGDYYRGDGRQIVFFPASPPFLFAGGPNFRSEERVAYELGWRVHPR